MGVLRGGFAAGQTIAVLLSGFWMMWHARASSVTGVYVTVGPCGWSTWRSAVHGPGDAVGFPPVGLGGDE